MTFQFLITYLSDRITDRIALEQSDRYQDVGVRLDWDLIRAGWTPSCQRFNSLSNHHLQVYTGAWGLQRACISSILAPNSSCVIDPFSRRGGSKPNHKRTARSIHINCAVQQLESICSRGGFSGVRIQRSRWLDLQLLRVDM